MAALSSFLLLGRASSSYSSLILGSLGSSSTSVFNLHNRLLPAPFLPFSTCSIIDHMTRFESFVKKSVAHPYYRDQPRLPIPDGFPFSIKDGHNRITVVRDDKDEKTKIEIYLRIPQLTYGNPSIQMYTSIVRGCWDMSLEVIGGPKTMRIRKADMRAEANHSLKCFGELLDTKGINARTISILFNLFRKNQKQKENITTDA